MRAEINKYIKELKGFTNTHEYYSKIETMAKNITT